MNSVLHVPVIPSGALSSRIRIYSKACTSRRVSTTTSLYQMGTFGALQAIPDTKATQLLEEITHWSLGSGSQRIVDHVRPQKNGRTVDKNSKHLWWGIQEPNTFNSLANTATSSIKSGTLGLSLPDSNFTFHICSLHHVWCQDGHANVEVVVQMHRTSRKLLSFTRDESLPNGISIGFFKSRPPLLQLSQ